MVIDVSGSMGGASIVQAKESLKLALGRLDPTDAFNIIAFNDSNWALYDGARPANRGNLLEAFRFVDNLEAGGGTEILAAMVRALGNAGADSRDDNNARLRQIIFVTDGSIGNEDEVFAAIEKHIGGSRLFTVGIGSAPNSHFMRRAARHGRGSFSHIGNPAQVSPRMKALLAKIERPVLTGIAVEWPHGWHVEAWPNPLPDLYHGEPVSLTARMPDDQPLSPGAKIIVSGQLAGKPWHLTLDLDQAREAKGVAALWAKNRITALEEARAQGADAEATKAEMLAVALGHEIVSRYTSLVAVDVTPSRTEDGTIVSREVPVMFPDGWTWDGVFGSPALESAAAAPRALKQAALRSLGKGAVLQTSRIILPQTATVAPRALLVGLIALAFGLALLLVSGFWRQASESFRP